MDTSITGLSLDQRPLQSRVWNGVNKMNILKKGGLKIFPRLLSFFLLETISMQPGLIINSSAHKARAV